MAERQRVTKDIRVELSKAQRGAAERVAEMIDHGASHVTLGGLAGTGKTTVVAALSDVLDMNQQEIAYCAFTGKAATVINKKMQGVGATTIHKLIYRTIEHHCASCPARVKQQENKRQGNNESEKSTMGWCHGPGCGECHVSFLPRDQLPGGKKLIIVDEASMVPESLQQHLQMYGIPIVWVGDHGQLPPVKSRNALMEYPDIVLEKVHRVVKDSPILQMAMRVRRGDVNGRFRPPSTGRDYGPGVTVRRGRNFTIGADELHRGNVIVLVPTNKLRAAVNRGARNKQGFPKDEATVGDRVVCLRNNLDQGIYNGMTGRILELSPEWLDSSKAGAVIALDGEDREYVGNISTEQFLAPETLGHLPRREMDLWDYGYGLTVHKAQGSEYPRVIIVADLSGVGGGSEMQKRWLYTAVTRATRELEIIYPE